MIKHNWGNLRRHTVQNLLVGVWLVVSDVIATCSHRTMYAAVCKHAAVHTTLSGEMCIYTTCIRRRRQNYIIRHVPLQNQSSTVTCIQQNTVVSCHKYSWYECIIPVSTLVWCNGKMLTISRIHKVTFELGLETRIFFYLYTRKLILNRKFEVRAPQSIKNLKLTYRFD